MGSNSVVAAVEMYVRGVTTGDAAVVESAFLPDAHMWGFLGDEFVSAPISEFVEVVATGPEPATWADAYAHEIRSVEVEGEIGRAVLVETGFVGANFTNFFTAVRGEEGWLLASKTFFLTAGDIPVSHE